MSNLKSIPLTFKQKLSESEFSAFQKKNRIYFNILTIIVLLTISSLFASIKLGIDTAMATGVLAITYTILSPICAAKNDKMVILWVIGSLVTAPLAFIPVHIRLFFIGKTNEWL